MAFELDEQFNIEIKTHNSLDFTLEVGNIDLTDGLDKVFLVVKKSVQDADYKFFKEFSVFTDSGSGVTNTVSISLTSTDLENIGAGEFIYEVVFAANSGKVHTLIPDGLNLNYSKSPKFKVIKGIYTGGN